MGGWYDEAIKGLKKAEKQEKVFIWMDDIDKIYEHEDALRDRFDEHEEDIDETLWRGFEGDPDKLNFDGCVVSYYTLEGCEDKKQYIIIAGFDDFGNYEVRQKVEEGLRLFYSENYKDHYEEMPEQSWQSFQSMKGKMLIAYRGGYGYTYSLYQRKEFKAEMQEA